MKLRILLPLLLATVSSSHAVIIYSGVQNVPIPQTFEGIYLRLSDGSVSGSFPADWNSAPWINPFFGGVFIGNNELLRPIVAGVDQILNVAPGTLISSSGNFVAGESGSTTHVGAAGNQFQLGTPGLIGLAFRTTVGGPDYYGWLRLTIENSGPGSIVDWAYENTAGAGILAGQTGAPGAVPDSSEGIWLILLAVPGFHALFRRRQVVGLAG